MRAGIVIGAAAYTGYLALLITCDLRRVESLGFSPAFASGTVRVAHLDSASSGARAGLANGDRLLRANRQILEGPVDWQRVRAHLDPAVPFELDIERGATTSTVTMQLRAGLTDLRSVLRRPALLGFRLAQLITLTLALVVAFRRSFQPAALAGALLLASIATVSLVLPMRIAVFWHALPAPASLLLWIPFATSVAAGPLMFVFTAVFPRRSWSTRALTTALLPAALVVGWHVFVGYQIMADPGAPTGLPDSITITAVVNALYGVLGIAVMVAHRSVADTPTDRRRIGVLIVGQLIGACAGVGVIAGYWRDPGGDIFASPTMTVLSLVFLAVPASFAYAILRHRLFDVSLIVRQGIRYAMTRRFIDALIPALGGLVLADVFVNRDQPVSVMIESRWWWFVLVGVALMVVRTHRDEWLKRVDRRFFRERYDAHRLLTSIADQTARAASFDATAPAIVQQIDEALRPTFVTLLRYVPAESAFNSVSSASAVEQSPRSLPASLSVIGVVAVLRKPLALSLGDTAWVRHQLPIEERSLLLDQGIELLVPMPGGTAGELPLGLLALGPRRSEQPYDQQDLDLLVTIAAAVGVLLERTTEEARGVAECENVRPLLRQRRARVRNRRTHAGSSARITAAQQPLSPGAAARPRRHGRGVCREGCRPRARGRGQGDQRRDRRSTEPRLAIPSGGPRSRKLRPSSRGARVRLRCRTRGAGIPRDGAARGHDAPATARVRVTDARRRGAPHSSRGVLRTQRSSRARHRSSRLEAGEHLSPSTRDRARTEGP